MVFCLGLNDIGLSSMAFSENLRDLRVARGMSQQQLADLIHVKQPTIAQYERGQRQPTICISIRIAKVL